MADITINKLYLSFLGTSDYVPCVYFQEGGQEFRDIRFVQEATAQIHCKEWGENDRIRIFTTDEAYRKNWLDGGQTSDEGRPLAGLRSCLEALGLRTDIQNVHIPDGKNEQEIWKIFDKTFDEIRHGDEVVLDITHAFRSIPLLANVVLNYAKVLKSISITGIYYGAFEVLGHPNEARKMELYQRRVPIFDLTVFDVLHDWSMSIDRFLETGDAVSVCKLATRGVGLRLSASRGKDRSAAGIKRIAQGLKELSKAISTCRAPEIKAIAASLKEEIARCDRFDPLPAFMPLLDRLRQKMVPFQGNDDVADGIQAARWCLDHNLIQQGYTILHESLITHCIGQIGEDPLDTSVRELIVYAARVFRNEDAGDVQQKVSQEQWEPFKRLRKFFSERPEFSMVLVNLAQTRNDLNHAGYRRDPMKADKFAPNLALFLGRVAQCLS